MPNVKLLSIVKDGVEETFTIPSGGGGGPSDPVELTEEHLTGELLEGKKVWEKVYNLTASNSNSSPKTFNDITLTSLDIDTLITINGVYHRLDAKVEISVLHSTATTDLSTVHFTTNGVLYEFHNNAYYNNAPFTLILKYTKKSD